MQLSGHTFRILSVFSRCLFFLSYVLNVSILEPLILSYLFVSPFILSREFPLTSLCKFPNLPLSFISIPSLANWTLPTGPSNLINQKLLTSLSSQMFILLIFLVLLMPLLYSQSPRLKKAKHFCSVLFCSLPFLSLPILKIDKSWLDFLNNFVPIFSLLLILVFSAILLALVSCMQTVGTGRGCSLPLQAVPEISPPLWGLSALTQLLQMDQGFPSPRNKYQDLWT